MNRLKEFFQESNGDLSMTRLLTFINVVVSMIVTIAIVFDEKAITTNDLTLIFELWLLTYVGNYAGKYMEKLPKQ
jgi:hypothetical protein